MAFAVSSSSSSLKSFDAQRDWQRSSSFFTASSRSSSLALPLHSFSASIPTFCRRRNRNSEISLSSSSKSKNFKKKNSSVADAREGEEVDDDAFEALFNMLEEDIKNDKSFLDDHNDDDDISEEDFGKLQNELEVALGINEDDDEDVELITSDGGYPNDVVDEDEEEEERPVKLKNWQMRRLARALKNGRRKTSIKSLSAELCLERAVVLNLLRDPPPNLVMMSAALRDHEPAQAPVISEAKPIEVLPLETKTVGDAKPESEKQVPFHVMQQSWSANKRLKKVHVDTLERVYKRSKRPTNSMITSIVQVTNLPRKRVVKWFEDKRQEDGVPDKRLPYQRSGVEAVSTH